MPSVGTVTSNLTATVQTGAYTAAAADLVLANAALGPFTVTLPAAPALNTLVAVKKIDTGNNAVTVVGSSPATIDGDPSCVLTAADAAATFTFDGVNWQIYSTANVNTGIDSLQAALVPNYTSGLWYDRRSVLDTPQATVSQAPTTVGASPVAPSQIGYFPCYAHRPVTITAIGVCTGSVAPTAGCTIRFGLYANTAANLPGARLYDWGTVTLTASANTAFNVAAAGTIPQGWSWWAVSLNATAAGSLYAINANAHPGPAVGAAAMQPLWAAQQPVSYYEVPGTSGTLNATATPTAVTPASNASVLSPNLWFKVA